MPGKVRIGDISVGICNHGYPCCPHYVIGTIVSGSPDSNINNLGAALLFSQISTTCPHCGSGYVIAGSPSCSVNNLPTHRVGDAVKYLAGSGVAVTGSGDCIAD